MIGAVKRAIHRRFPTRSLQSQLLARALFILAALLLLVGMLQYWIMQDFVYRNKARTMQEQLMAMPPLGVILQERLRQNSQTSENRNTVDGKGRPYLFFPGLSLAVYDEKGMFIPITGANDHPPPQLSNKAYQDVLSQTKTRERAAYQLLQDSTGAEQMVVLGKTSLNGRSSKSYVVQMGALTRPLREIILRQLATFAGLSVLALLAGLMLYLPVLRRTLVPLSNMIDRVQRIDAGRLDERLPDRSGQQEIDRLALSFNGMLERLEQAFTAERESKEQMKRFISDASHELRTPLTSIHGFIEVLQRGAATSPQQLSAALGSMHGESIRIQKLVSDLLLLTRLDQAPPLHRAPLLLDELILSMQPQLELLAGKRQLSLELTPEVRLLADADKLKQVLLNLVHNAVQHTDATTGWIVIRLDVEDSFIRMSVADNGPGIEAEHLPHLFERFYRTASSRTRTQGGAGLGLAITESIAHIHGGHIEVESQVGKGTCFTLFLPQAPVPDRHN